MASFIHGIGIQNFKAFKNYQFCQFSDISFLIGKNGVGKSSFLQAAQFVISYLSKSKTTLDEIIDENYKIIDINRILGEELFDENQDFTNILQFVNDTNKPLVVDIVFDFGFVESIFIISPIKYQFIFSIVGEDEDYNLLLEEFNIYNFENNNLLISNNVKSWDEPYNIEITKEGKLFLLTSFIEYINFDDTIKKTYKPNDILKTKAYNN